MQGKARLAISSPTGRALGCLAAMALSWPLSKALDHGCEAWLRQGSAALAAGFLRMAGYDAARTGAHLRTPLGEFEVLQACSGGNFLAVTLALGAGLFALGRVAPGRGVPLAVSLVPLAVAGNALRVAGLILLGGAGDPWLHTVLGVWCFGLVAVTVCAVAGAWRGAER